MEGSLPTLPQMVAKPGKGKAHHSSWRGLLRAPQQFKLYRPSGQIFALTVFTKDFFTLKCFWKVLVGLKYIMAGTFIMLCVHDMLINIWGYCHQKHLI